MRDETAAGAAAGDGTAEASTAGASAAGDAAPRAGGRRHRRLGLGAAAAVSAAVVAVAAFAVTGALSGPGRARPASVIPAPPRANKVFVEDDDGTGADNQANILHVAAPGLVHVLPVPGRTAGAGIVLTPSGLVLTSAQMLQGTRRVTVRLVLSGRSFPARVVGTDPAHGLGLLQIVSARPFRPVAVGNSRYLARGAGVTAVGSPGLTRTFTLNIGNLSRGAGEVAVGGQRLTGLLVSTARVAPGEETGGPLVSLSGQVIGISVAGTGRGLQHTSFAVPIDTALAVARRIQAAHSR